MPRLNHPIPNLPNYQLMPACPKCSARMKILRATPTEEGLEDRTFECPKCNEMDTLVFSTN
jgi:transcription initiation factor IIE alpha subunit